MWILLVFGYGAIKGVRDILKKKSLQISSPIEVLFWYTLISLVLVSPGIKTALGMDMSYMPFIVLKSFIIFIGWMCGYKAMSKMPVGLYGVMDMARVVFAAVLGVAILGESFSLMRGIGMALVIAGLLLVNLKKDTFQSDGVRAKIILMMLVCCLCNACSEILDKFLMPNMSSTQLQFWYTLYLVIFYLIYILAARVKLSVSTLKSNFWIWICAVLFVIGDKLLFIACGQADSTVIAMTLIKQCSVLFTIIGGRLVFKEKNTLVRLLCAALIIAGIGIALV